MEIKTDDLNLMITNTGEEIAAAQKEVADTQLQIKKASQNREAENFDYQSTINEQAATQAILKKAVDRLKEYKKSGGAAGVMSMIETIIEESVQVSKDAAKA